MSQSQVLVQPPGNFGVGATPFSPGGRQGEPLISELHGKFYTANQNGKLFKALATGFTNPAIASAVASKFAFVNPLGSGVLAEIISTAIALVVTPAVQTSIAWYWQNIATNVPTSPTAITAVSGIVGSGNLPACTAYSALTALTATTPVLAELIATINYVTAAGLSLVTVEKLHDGRLIVPPGIGLFMAGAAASTASSVAAQVDWIEWPLPL